MWRPTGSRRGPGHVACPSRSPGRRPPWPLVSLYFCVNGSLVLLDRYFSGKRWAKRFLKINSSSNAHFLRGNGRHLSSSNGPWRVHVASGASPSPAEGCRSARLPVEETGAQRSRSQELLSGHRSPIRHVPWCAPSLTPAPCSAPRGGPHPIVRREMNLS